MNPQPIRPGQVWRRNSDGQEFIVVERRPWHRHEVRLLRRGFTSSPGCIFTGMSKDELFGRHTLISDPTESTTPPTREDQP